MSKRAIKLDKIDEIETFEKKDIALRNAIAKRLHRLAARQNAFRGLESANVGKPIAPKHRGK